jgi:hypothetical protein
MNLSASQILREFVSSFALKWRDYPKTFATFGTLLGIFSLWPFSGGEDVANARENILNGEKSDFWGGFSQLFYSAFGMRSPTWSIALGLTHALIILFGTIVVIRTLRPLEKSKYFFHLLFIIHFLATTFVLNLSRDGSLLAFSWLGTALVFRSAYSVRAQFLSFTTGVLFFIIGLAFRPWLAVAFVPLLLAVLLLSKKVGSGPRKFITLLLTSILISIGPLSLDFGIKKLMNLQKSYPEQQVIILDLASVACLSPVQTSQDLALNALEPVSKLPNLSRQMLCGSFYPQSWGPLVFYSENAPLRLIKVNEESTYKAIRSAWLELIITQPQQYLQIKVFQFTQLFFAGDSIQLIPEQLRQFPLIPYEALKALRLFSFLPIFLLFSWITFSSRHSINQFLCRSIYLSYLIAISLVTIAFTGDNQRYIAWLALLHSFAFIISPHKLSKF